ncbi:hypothetical protein EGW08_023171 [Elysia chlorotica]|uniref:Uncharacterized protein n=1 Tax=Elysia chlorotica TaxID=188477 RepID=A0A3S1AWE1_ELYCH|nr:hypothetical protein EGW08_023171 [Elysia chlorotica]
MGNWLFKGPQRRIVIQGLDASGKTSLLYGLKLGEVIQTVPTVGYNVETVTTPDGGSFTCWDLGGQEKVRPLYRHYYPNTHGYVYVLDSGDRERLGQALDEFVQYVLLEELTRGAVVLVLANKQDVPGALSALDVERALRDVYNFSVRGPGSGHTVLVRPCSTLTMEGVREAFHDFAEEIRLNHAGKGRSGLISLEDDANNDTEAQVQDADKSIEVQANGLGRGLGSDKQAEIFAHREMTNWSKTSVSLLRTVFE